MPPGYAHKLELLKLSIVDMTMHDSLIGRYTSENGNTAVKSSICSLSPNMMGPRTTLSKINDIVVTLGLATFRN